MAEDTGSARPVEAKGRTVQELLTNQKYSIEYYQREYKWQKKQLTELIDDLTLKFFEDFENEHDRQATKHYGHYFLGSVIISDKGTKKGRSVIDGQQRLTTLTLILIYLRHHLNDSGLKTQLENMICSYDRGDTSFNLIVEAREPCMAALYEDKEYIAGEADESVKNMLDRYGDLGDCFPEELLGKPLPYFVDWLIGNVHFVEITAYTEGDAYKIFETMNDRGLSLSPIEMLKGHLLNSINPGDDRNKAADIWKDRIRALISMDKEEDSDAIRSWLRSQYADKIRENKKGAQPEDFDLIGTEPHRWVHRNEERLNLRKSSDFRKFIDEDFVAYSQWYEQMRLASVTRSDGFQSVYYNAGLNFTLQYPIALAPLKISDSKEEAKKKINIVTTYLDIFINRRIWNWRSTGYSTMRYAMFQLMKDLRGNSIDQLVEDLTKRLSKEEEKFLTNENFRLNGGNRFGIHRLLARLTEYVESSSELPSHFEEYVIRGGRNAYEIEHIWAKHFDRHEGVFPHENDFLEYRNKIGGLVLLQKKKNESLNDKTYEQKLPFYEKENLLVQSLTQKAYQHDPPFKKFIVDSGLDFHPIDHFTKDDLDSRQNLYCHLAEKVWSPDRLSQEAI